MSFPLSRTVVVLGFVSFFNDTASEMITPLLPVFLTTMLGAGPAVVGLVEGVAEATASILKLVSGRLADRAGKARRLVLGGYGLSNAARPLIGISSAWGMVLLLRFLDRVGKGLRTSPRDALIAGDTAPHLRGKAFGFQRALDHAGAIVGPLLAFGLLSWGVYLGHIFLLSVVPGLLVLTLLTVGLPKAEPGLVPARPAPLSWRAVDPLLRAVILSAGGLALATTPEAFLVLWARDRGLGVVWVPLLWAAASAVKAAVAVPGGHLSDRSGRLPVLITGWSARILILVSLGLAGNGGGLTVWALFLAYAGALAFTEGPERALISDLAPEGQRATAYGLYHMTAGLLALPGAVLFGALWEWFGATAAFLTAAGLTTLSVTALVAAATRRRVA